MAKKRKSENTGEVVRSDEKSAEEHGVRLDEFFAPVFRMQLIKGSVDVLHFLSIGAAKILGIDDLVDGITAATVWDLVHEQDIKGLRDSVLKASTKEFYWDYEWRINQPNNGLRWIRGTGKAMAAKDGSITWDVALSDVTAGKNARIEAEISKNELQKILDCSIDVICTIDKNGFFTRVSRASLQLWGYGPEEMEGRPYRNFVHPDDRGITDNTETSIQGGVTVRNFENRYVHKNGDIVPIIWSAWWDESSDLMHCVARDGREKQEAERRIREQDRRFRALVQDGSDLIAIMNEEGLFTYVSPSFEYHLGYNETDLIGESAFDFIHPDMVEKMLGYFNQLKKNRRVHTPPFRFKSKSGEWHWLQTIGTNLTDDPAVAGYVMNTTDVTAILETQNRLKESEEHYRAIYDKSPLPKLIFGVETLQILDANKTASEIYGYSKQELLNKTLRELSSEEQVSELLEALSVSEDEDGIYRFGVLIHKKKDGTKISMDSTAKRIVYQGQNAMLLSCLNVTERERLAESLVKKDQMLERAHDIAKMGYWSLDLKTNELTGSNQMYRIWDIEKNDFNHTLNDSRKMVHPEDLDGLEKVSESLAKGLVSEFSHQHRIITGKGEVRWIQVIANLIKDTTGKPKRIEGISQDITESKTEEQQLRLLQSVVTNTNDSVIITEAEPIDAPGGPKIVYVNDAFTRLTGYTAEEAIGNTPRMLQGPKTDRNELDRIRKHLENWESFEATVLNYRKNGEEMWLHMSISPVADETGWFTHWVSVERDVTQQKIAQLQKSMLADIGDLFNRDETLPNLLRETLRYITDYTSASFAEIWTVSGDENKLVQASHYAHDEAGALFLKQAVKVRKLNTYEGLPGAAWKKGDTLFWDNLATRKRFVRSVMAEKSGINNALALPLLHNNEVVAVLMIGSSGNSNDLKKYAGLFTELKTFLGAEFKRKQVEDDLQRLFDTAPDIICITGFDGKFRRVSKAAELLLEYSKEELIGRPFTDFLHPDDLAKSIYEKERIVDGESPLYFENRYLTKSGRTIWLAWTSTPAPVEGLIFSVAKNVTEQKELQNLLDSASSLARIGSWEVDLEKGTVYWSDITQQIHEVDTNFTPKIEDAINFYREDQREIVQSHLQRCLEFGEPVDFEQAIITANGIERWVKVIGKAELRNGKPVRVFGSIQDITDQKTSELNLARQSEYLTNMSRIVEVFLKSEDWHNTLEDCFRLAGEALDADRVYFFEHDAHPDDGRPVFNQRFEWNSGISESQIDNPDMQLVDMEVFPEFSIPMKNGECYTAITSRLHDSPLKDVLESQDIKSVLSLPVFTENNLRGFIGFDDCKTEREWTRDELSFAEALASNFASAILRRDNFEQLQRSYEERNQILERITGAFFAVNTDWIVTYWNKEAETILGIKREEIIDQILWDFFPEARELKFFEMYNHALNAQEYVFFEEFYPEMNRWFEAHAYPSPEGLSVFFRDITEKKTYEERLRQSNERFEKAAQATQDAIWDWNIQSGELFWGDGYQTLFGISPEAASKGFEAWVNHVHPDDRDEVVGAVERLVEGSEGYHYEKEYRFKRIDGNYAFVIDRGIVIRDDTGKAIRMVGALTDISHRKEYEESLKRLNEQLEIRARELAISNAELEQFAYVASHDLQEPLRMISSFLTQLEKKYSNELDEKAHKYIHFAVDGARRMRQIILDLLDFSRVGKHSDELTEVDLNELMDEVVSLQQRLIDEKQARISYSELPAITGYRTPLVQVMQNLISNALKYSRDGVPPDVQIEVKSDRKFWEVHVIDNGIGIDEEYFDKIFVIFHRLHTKEVYGGTGMGLAIVKKIVENLGGSIGVSSTLGKGSTFILRLPKKPVSHSSLMLKNT